MVFCTHTLNVRLCRSQLDQGDFEFRQYAIDLFCKQEGAACGSTHTDPFKRRERGTVRDHCNGVSVSLSQPKHNGPIAITSFKWEHSHDIPSTIVIPRTPFPPAVLTDIEKYVNAHTDAGQIRAFITADYGYYSSIKLNNAIEKCRRDQRGDPNLDAADFATLLRSDPNVAFSRLCVRPMGQLTGGFWVLRDQVSVLQRFWRVLLQDITHGTNIYRLKLSLICVVDHCFKTRVAAQAVIFGECGDWHAWVFESLRIVLAGLTPSPLTLFPTQSGGKGNASFVTPTAVPAPESSSATPAGSSLALSAPPTTLSAASITPTASATALPSPFTASPAPSTPLSASSPKSLSALAATTPAASPAILTASAHPIDLDGTHSSILLYFYGLSSHFSAIFPANPPAFSRSLDTLSYSEIVFATDFDRAARNAIAAIFPNAPRIVCQWHMDMAMRQRVPRWLNGDQYRQFFDLVAAARARYLSHDSFAGAMRQLRVKYAAHTSLFEYLDRTWFSISDSWAAWSIRTSFSAGIQVTSRVEGMNAKLKKIAGTNASARLTSLFANVSSLVARQRCTEAVFEAERQQPRRRSPREHRISAYQAMVAIVECLCMRPLLGMVVDKMLIAMECRVDPVSSLKQECLSSRLEYQDRATVQEWIDCSIDAWHVHLLRDSPSHGHFVVLLKGHELLCTCLHQIHTGFPCSHLFAVMLHDNRALFTVFVIGISLGQLGHPG